MVRRQRGMTNGKRVMGFGRRGSAFGSEVETASRLAMGLPRRAAIISGEEKVFSNGAMGYAWQVTAELKDRYPVSCMVCSRAQQWLLNLVIRSYKCAMAALINYFLLQAWVF